MSIKLKRMAIVILFTTIFCNSCDLGQHNVIYDGNGHTSGSVPTDETLYNFLEPVTVLDNTGNLKRTNYTFAGWSQNIITYTPGQTFSMGWSDVTLKAVWDDANQCVFKNCFPEIIDCLFEPECFTWLTCIQGCGDDKFKCPTFCGMYYRSTIINQISICALGNECPVVDFSDLGPCIVPEAEFFDLSNMSGTWWLYASSGEDHMFDFDCQQFVFEVQNPTLLNVNYSVTLSLDGIEKQRGTEGTFEQMEDGSIKVEYGSYAAYHENWYLVHKSENTLLSHVCFTSDADSQDYGTLVLSRMPLENLEMSEYSELDAAVNNYFGKGIEQLTPVIVEGCSY